MPLENHQQLHQTFFELCIYRDNVQLKKSKKEQICHILLGFCDWSGTESHKKASMTCFITHFLSLIAFRSKFRCMRIIINSIITLHSSWLLQQSGTDFNVPPFSKIDLSHNCWVWYWSVTYLNRSGNFLTTCLHIFLVLRWSVTRFNISGFLITVQYLFSQIYRCSYYIHYQQYNI